MVFKIIIDWYDNYCQINPNSDFYDELKSKFPIENTSKSKVDSMLYKFLSNHHINHYGLLEEHTTIEHNIIY